MSFHVESDQMSDEGDNHMQSHHSLFLFIECNASTFFIIFLFYLLCNFNLKCEKKEKSGSSAGELISLAMHLINV